MGKFEEFELPVQLTRNQQAAKMREAFPVSAESIDFMRELFGADIVVLAVDEAGLSHKTKSYKADDECRTVIDGAQFVRLGMCIQQEKERAEERTKHARRK